MGTKKVTRLSVRSLTSLLGWATAPIQTRPPPDMSHMVREREEHIAWRFMTIWLLYRMMEPPFWQKVLRPRPAVCEDCFDYDGTRCTDPQPSDRRTMHKPGDTPCTRGVRLS